MSPELRVMPSPVCVFGASGLLGGAVTRALRLQGETVQRIHVPWGEDGAVRSAADQVGSCFAEPSEHHLVYWCAGIGMMSATYDDLRPEGEVLLGVLESLDLRAPETPVVIVFVSSAGALYAGNASDPECPYTEKTVPKPVNPYGRAKLRLEGVLRTWASGRTDNFVAIARPTNVYGPGQDLAKGQGLISTVVNRLLNDAEMDIFAPLESSRDYIYADDAGRTVAALGREMIDAPPADRVLVKNICQGAQSTIQDIVDTAQEAVGRRLNNRYEPAPGARMALDVQSVVACHLDDFRHHSLAEGIDAVYRAALGRQGRSES